MWSPRREAAEAEWEQHIVLLQAAERHLVSELVPAEAVEKGNAVLEIRPGAGGREASLFALDLWKMYERCAKRHGWRIEAVNILDNTDGGVRHLSVRSATALPVDWNDSHRRLTLHLGRQT